MPEFSDRSMSRLMTCDPRLQKVMERVVEHFDCTIICGHRNEADQEVAFASGMSKAHFGQSKHNSLPSMAVDVGPWPLDWNDKCGFYRLAGFVQAMAAMESDGTWSLRWGGDFKSFFDGAHYEIVDRDAQ